MTYLCLTFLFLFSFLSVFAVVTESSKLVLYDIRLSDETPMFSIDASFKPILSLDWHPTRKYIVATGGKDCLVKGMLELFLIFFLRLKLTSESNSVFFNYVLFIMFKSNHT